jgi:hypothetical protein
MAAPYPETVKDDLARWLAAGGTLHGWCERQPVSLMTAWKWSLSDAFRRKVEVYRRREADRAFDRMARHLDKAFATAGHRADRGGDDRNKLAAARSVIDPMVQGAGRVGLSTRLRRLEERLAALGDGPCSEAADRPEAG